MKIAFEGRAYTGRWNQEKSIKKKNQNNKNKDYLSDTPSNSSSLASSLMDRQFRKRKGPFSKQNEIEGRLQQAKKKKKKHTLQRHSKQNVHGVMRAVVTTP